ncbi:FGGY family carbohydrate kinase [Alteromonas sp. M12]|uniref:FGGY-family carbohydrate kinase n=1 Tax=Alteromonas sp. M12 TaxID=3135644 RepID=UPI00319EA5C4
MYYSLILDIGKTNVKLHLLDENRKSVFSESRANNILSKGKFPHADVDGIFDWMASVCQRLTAQFEITAFSVTTHGATAALIDRNSEASSNGLVLPVLDYEYSGIGYAEYDDLRPEFSESLSPKLPAGLNLGKQLFWLQKRYPDAFSKCTDILMYPQYWVWRLTGQRCTEVTSLGCHTDLWAPLANDYSSLVKKMKWQTLFPEIVPAWQNIGKVSPSAAKLTGLSTSCEVFAGIHDSNASFLRYKIRQNDKPFTVISTGTWTVLMSSGTSTSCLSAKRDMLGNVDAMSSPIPCARFMGGREFEKICAMLGGAFGDPVESSVLQELINKEVMAIPDFSGGSGPFGGHTPAFIGEIEPKQGTETATLYCALMIDFQLDLLQSKSDIYIEGAFLQNPLLCSIIAQLRPGQPVWLSADNTGTVQGCASLIDWQKISSNSPLKIDLKPAVPTRLTNLKNYRDLWRERVQNS